MENSQKAIEICRNTIKENIDEDDDDIKDAKSVFDVFPILVTLIKINITKNIFINLFQLISFKKKMKRLLIILIINIILPKEIKENIESRDSSYEKR